MDGLAQAVETVERRVAAGPGHDPRPDRDALLHDLQRLEGELRLRGIDAPPDLLLRALTGLGLGYLLHGQAESGQRQLDAFEKTRNYLRRVDVIDPNALPAKVRAAMHGLDATEGDGPAPQASWGHGLTALLRGHQALERYQSTASPYALELAITYLQFAVERIEPPGRPAAQVALAIALNERHHAAGDSRDLAEAAGLLRAAVSADLAPAERADVLLNLSEVLRLQGTEDRTSPELLDDAVRAGREALGLVDPESVDGSVAARTLGLALAERFRHQSLDADRYESTRLLADVGATTQARDPILPQRLGTLVRTLIARHETISEPRAVGTAASRGTTLPASVRDGPLAYTLTRHGLSLLNEYWRSGDAAPLHEAVRVLRRALTAPLDANVPRLDIALVLAGALRWVYETLGDESAFREARQLIDRTEAEASAVGEHFGWLLGKGELLQGDPGGGVETRREAASLLRRAVDVAGARDSRLRAEAELGRTLGLIFDDSHDPGVADESLAILRRVCAETSTGNPNWLPRLVMLAEALVRQYQAAEAPELLDEAIQLAESVGASWPTPSDLRNTPRLALARALALRGARNGRRADADRAVTLLEELLSPSLRPRQGSALAVELAQALTLRYRRWCDDADAERALSLLQRGRDGLVSEADDPRLPEALLEVLVARFEITGRFDGLEEALDASRRSRDSQVSFNRIAAAVNLFHVGKGLPLLDEAIAEVRLGVPREDGHPDRPEYLVHLASLLQLRHRTTGQIDDLDEAVDLGEEAVQRLHQRPLRAAEALAVLSVGYRLRYELTASRSDLDAAVERGQVACQLVEDSKNPASRTALAAAGQALLRRWHLTRVEQDYVEAKDLLTQGLGSTSERSPDRPVALTQLGNALRAHHEAGGDVADLIKAESLFNEAATLTEQSHASRAIRYGNLGNVRAELAKTFPSEPRYVDLAIEAQRVAAHATREGDAEYAAHWRDLGTTLRQRYQRAGESGDRDEGLAALRNAVQSNASRAVDRIVAGAELGEWAWALGDVKAAYEAYAAAVTLLPTAAWHGLDREVRESRLASWPSLAADAAIAAVAAERPVAAVELLETGRSVLWNQMLSLRADLDRLRIEHPILHRRLEDARRVLDHKMPREQLGEAPSSDPAAYRRAALAWDIALVEIRRLPGYRDFLGVRPYADLQAAVSAGGYVLVVVASRWGCVVLVVGSEGAPGVIHLDAVAYHEVVERAQLLLDALRVPADATSDAQEQTRHTMYSILSWLWEQVVVQVLPHVAPVRGESREPRVWWCPTGPFMVLPLHAAGRYARDEQEAVNANENVAAHVVSSYIPTLSALARAKATPPNEDQGLLLVGVPETGGHRVPALPGVREELLRVRKFAAETISGDRATATAVSRALVRHTRVHFACHAGQDQRHPMQSGLELWDVPLTLDTIAGLEGLALECAFLSACETARGHLPLMDESIHIASCLQLVGCRHVVATMWSVSDAFAPRLAEDFYATLEHGESTPLSPAHALRQAVASLRERQPYAPSLWAPYVHIGC